MLKKGLAALLMVCGLMASAGAQTTSDALRETAPPGPVRLIQPPRAPLPPSLVASQAAERRAEAPRAFSPFEHYVSRLADGPRPPEEPQAEPTVRRFGADLLWASPAPERDGAVPDDYVLGPGDELLLDLWGSVEASLRLRVGPGGSISIPRVGAVSVAGRRFGELAPLLRQRVAQSFKQFDLALGMGELRSVRVLVTGFVQRPGQHSLSALAGLSQALAAAGGPSAVGSLRRIEHRRAGSLLASVDLYELLLKGQGAAERRIQAGDVIHVPAAGPQVGVIGAVQHPAVFELKGEETVADLLAMAGGLGPVANRQRAVLLALDGEQPVRELDLAQAGSQRLQAGEVLRVHSLAELNRPSQALHKRVRVEGEVLRPGDYVLPAGATLREALAAAGGPSPEAYLFGAELRRETVRRRQMEGYDRALRELETEFTRAAVTRKERPPPEGTPDSRVAHLRLIERLRQVQPSGRVVLQLGPTAQELPALPLEEGDQLIVPGRRQAISVYGSVFNGGSFEYREGTDLAHYLQRAGGPTRGADTDSLFVLRADGSVASTRMQSFWSRQGLQQLPALPGDTLFVPEDLDRLRLSQELKDWAQILAQFGLGAVALKNLTQ